MPWADVLYGCDAKWWHAHDGCPDFAGEKWSGHNDKTIGDNKIKCAERYDLNLVRGEPKAGFSTDPSRIHYNDNSGAQALNLCILFGATYIVLVGFDLRHVDGRAHFFGNHPSTLHQRPDYSPFIKKFSEPPEGVTIVNATPESALRIYPMVALDEAFSTDYRLRRNGAVINALAD